MVWQLGSMSRKKTEFIVAFVSLFGAQMIARRVAEVWYWWVLVALAVWLVLYYGLLLFIRLWDRRRHLNPAAHDVAEHVDSAGEARTDQPVRSS